MYTLGGTTLETGDPFGIYSITFEDPTSATLAVMPPVVPLRLTPADAIENIYRHLNRLGRPLEGERTRAETAYEFKQKLLQQINVIQSRFHFTRYLFHAQENIQLLTDIYQDALFAQNRIDKNDTRTALNAWKDLRWRLFFARMNAFALDRFQRGACNDMDQYPLS